MTKMRGYYSLVQFCPDPSRLEAVNVGVLLFCPEANFIRARTAKGCQRPAKLVGRAGVDVRSLNAAKRAIERRLEVDREAFQTVDDLQRFVDTRANILRLTCPRPVKVFNPEQDLDKLFDELVGRSIRSGTKEPLIPELESAFHRLRAQGRARLDWEINVPVAEVPLQIPYAYRNGAWNLIKPYEFSARPQQAVQVAMQLAVEGDLLKRHGTEDTVQMNLVVVSLFKAGNPQSELETRVHEVFQEYNVTAIPQSKIQGFLALVEQEAHA